MRKVHTRQIHNTVKLLDYTVLISQIEKLVCDLNEYNSNQQSRLLTVISPAQSTLISSIIFSA